MKLIRILKLIFLIGIESDVKQKDVIIQNIVCPCFVLSYKIKYEAQISNLKCETMLDVYVWLQQ